MFTDFQLIFKDEESGFLTSNRAFGIGGDDIYHFKINRRALNADELPIAALAATVVDDRQEQPCTL